MKQGAMIGYTYLGGGADGEGEMCIPRIAVEKETMPTAAPAPVTCLTKPSSFLADQPDT